MDNSKEQSKLETWLTKNGYEPEDEWEVGGLLFTKWIKTDLVVIIKRRMK